MADKPEEKTITITLPQSLAIEIAEDIGCLMRHSAYDGDTECQFCFAREDDGGQINHYKNCSGERMLKILWDAIIYE
jgi:hypothetical protein